MKYQVTIEEWYKYRFEVEAESEEEAEEKAMEAFEDERPDFYDGATEVSEVVKLDG